MQQAKIFGDTINGLGGSAVPMAWGEVITAAKQGVIDGGDLPIVNMKALKIYEVSKYASLTYHNYGPTNAVMNLDIWNGLAPDQQKLMLDLSRAAQEKIREATESVDNFAKAKEELEPLGMTVVEAKVEEFRKVAQAEDLAGLQEPVRRAVGRDRRLQGLMQPGPDRSRPLAAPSAAGSVAHAAYLSAVPKFTVTALIILAIVNLLVGVILRYFVGAITDWLDVDPVPFTWVEEVGELSLAWLTLIGAAIGIQSRSHFTLAVFVHRLPEARAALDPPVQPRADHGHRPVWWRGTASSCACSTATLTTPGLQINLAWLYASAVVGGILIAIYGFAVMIAPPPPAASRGTEADRSCCLRSSPSSSSC